MGLFEVPEEFDASDWWVKTPPAIEPVTLQEVKNYVKLDGTSEDTYLESMITAVRLAMEGHLGRSLISQTLVLRMDSWPSDTLTLPRPPLISVVEVRTLDEDGTETVYAATNYYVILGERSELVIRQGKAIPSNVNRYKGGYEVEYTAGYGTAAADVPEAIRQAILQWIAAVYETKVPDLSNIPINVKATLGLPYQRLQI